MTQLPPVLQFAGRAQLGGVADVVRLLRGVLEPLSTASFLTAPHRDLNGATPVERLRAGDVDEVLRVTRRLARTAA
jgi:hypothetical protein